MEHRVHQDYIVRQRFSNALPAPPGAPKLLEIPTGGLKQYTMPPYASRLARQHPLNIEADADLGMPIDLVGMPGVFEGDEHVILAPLRPPVLHPADKDLLRPLKSIGQVKKEKEISFLRRTQFTAEGGLRQAAASTSTLATPKRRRLDTSKEDPKAILRNTIKGFDLANPEDAYTGPDTADRIRGAQPTPAEVEAWKHPKHPSNASLKPVDFYPVIPDLDAITLDGGFMVTRFQGNPADNPDKKAPRVNNAGGGGSSQTDGGAQRSDPLMDLAMLRVMDPDPEAVEEYQRKLEKHDEDPVRNKHPGALPLRYEVFLPENENVLYNATRAYDVGKTPEHGIHHLYTSTDPKPHFRFARTRFYEQRAGASYVDHPYEWVGLVLNDGEVDGGEEKLDDDLGLGDDDEETGGRKRKLQKAAYFAPVASTAQLRPRRGNTDRFGRLGNRDEEQIDILQLRIADEQGEERQTRRKRKDSLDPDGEVE